MENTVTLNSVSIVEFIEYFIFYDSEDYVLHYIIQYMAYLFSEVISLGFTCKLVQCVIGQHNVRVRVYAGALLC